YIPLIPVTADSNGVKEYTIDSYVPNLSDPIVVDTIPDNASTGNVYSDQRTLNYHRSQQASNARYVLDQVPVLVNYERTIY
ncbi:hypothetical protein JW979_14160, partial [bacterium]|nr:hypothetical protein [candidate division CSSED10-310 bacterium]